MYEHGGNIYANPDILDFSANINPLGIPERVRHAVLSSVDSLIHYPDPGCRSLREAIGKKEHVPASRILCGNGAADLIFTLCYALHPKHALLPAPSFWEYAQALQSCGCQIHYSILLEETHFSVTKQFLSDLKRGTYDIIFLCNPNNPTGQLIDAQLLSEILHYCEQHGIFMVVDECFLDFTKQYHASSMIPYLSASKYLLILKAFTKMYAIPGLRLGYLLSENTDFLQNMQSFRQPWSVSTPAQAAGIAAFGGRTEPETDLQETETHPAKAHPTDTQQTETHPTKMHPTDTQQAETHPTKMHPTKICRTDAWEAYDWEEKTRRFVEKERTWIKENLPFYPMTGEANYLFFSSDQPLWEECKKHGIFIRDCKNFVSLEQKHYYRIAVKKREENEQLVKLLSSLR